MITFDIDDLIDEMIDNEISRYCDGKFKKFEDINDINDAMLGITIDCDGDIVTISDLSDKDYKIFREELNKLTKDDIECINNAIIEDVNWKDEIPNNAWRNK